MWAIFLYDKFDECSKDSQVDALVFVTPYLKYTLFIQKECEDINKASLIYLGKKN